MDWNPDHEAVKAIYSLISGAIFLLATWFVGQRLTYAWNVRQKRREFQLSASQQFYSAYGEFFANWKLWNRLDHASTEFDARRWEVYQRAAAAEAIIEGMLLKLSSEVPLSAAEIESLGRFRQSFQQLREAIQNGRPMDWHSSEHPEYKAFKNLSIQVAGMLGKDWPRFPPEQAVGISQFAQITSNRWEVSPFQGPSLESSDAKQPSVAGLS